VAVDNILRKLLSVAGSNSPLFPFSLGPGGILRVGEPGAIGAGLAEYSLEAAVPGAKNRAGFWDKKKVRAAINKAMVVFATCASAGGPIMEGGCFSLVIIDEASQVDLH
jgi:hypothetical protein